MSDDESFNFNDLPDELVLEVIGRLPRDKMALISAVSRRYKVLWDRNSAWVARAFLLQAFHPIIHEFDDGRLSLSEAMAFLIECSADCRRQRRHFQNVFVKAVRLCLNLDDFQGALVLSWLIGLDVYELRDILQGDYQRCQVFAENCFCDEKTNPVLKNILLPFVSVEMRQSFIREFNDRVLSGASEAYCCFANIQLSHEVFIILSNSRFSDLISLFGVNVRQTSRKRIHFDIQDWHDVRFATFEGLHFDVFKSRQIDGTAFVNCAFESVLFDTLIARTRFRRCSFRQVSFAEGQQFSEVNFVRCRLDSSLFVDLYRAGIRDFQDFQQLDSAVVADFFGVDFETVKLPEIGWDFSHAKFDALAIRSLCRAGLRELKGLQAVDALFLNVEMSMLSIRANDLFMKFQHSKLSRLDVQTYGRAPRFVFIDCTLIDCLFFHHGTNKSLWRVERCVIDEATLRILIGEGARSFVGCQFLPGTTFKGLDISGCNFTGAVLRGVDLRGCRFNDKTIFRNADLSDTIWSGVEDLSYARRSNFEGTLFDRRDSAPSSLFYFIASAMLEAHYDDCLKNNARSDYFMRVLYSMLSMYVDERCHHVHRASAREMMASIERKEKIGIPRDLSCENERGRRPGRFSQMLRFFVDITAAQSDESPGVLPSLDPSSLG